MQRVASLTALLHDSDVVHPCAAFGACFAKHALLDLARLAELRVNQMRVPLVPGQHARYKVSMQHEWTPLDLHLRRHQRPRSYNALPKAIDGTA